METFPTRPLQLIPRYFSMPCAEEDGECEARLHPGGAVQSKVCVPLSQAWTLGSLQWVQAVMSPQLFTALDVLRQQGKEADAGALFPI